MLNLPVLVLVMAPEGAGEKVKPGVMADQPERFYVLECGQVEQGLARLGGGLENSWGAK